MQAEDRVFFTFVAVILVVLSFFIGFDIRGMMERDSALKAGAARYYLDSNNEKKFEYLGAK